MERKDFLRTLGAGAALVITFPCLGGCSTDDGNDGNIVTTPTNVDFTIDLTSAEAVKLTNNGGFILKNLVVVVRNLEGNFIAASQICSHKQFDQVRFDSRDGGTFHCNVHAPAGSRFSQDGTPLVTPNNSTPRALKIYNTELNGDILRVFE